ncbi:MAG: histidine kinase [Candidatus Cloacimonas sp. 4484_143]|nr:MAG: histidine kinase [Candidatus Cloacimonas sp. 4484_143]RLC52302.1 MAG: histidine kinase [Candidatus Cloacimonadota bacterium]RLC54420.1 MAG: histidine kinase [Candidatus Cloacimonadota bacterium]
MKESSIFYPEIQMYKWWSKIRWFIVMVLFAIGILQVTNINNTYPIIIFVVVFIGISILNVLFHLQIIKTNTLWGTLQVLFDIIFATLVVHLTGGLSSSFVWIYLIAVITASISIESSGGIIAAMIGSMSLLALLLMYNFKILMPVNGAEFDPNIQTQTIFLISYTGLFSGIAFISSFISDLIKRISEATKLSKKYLDDKDEEISEKQEMILQNKKKIEEYKEVVTAAAEIASLDHDINNPLTIISLSIRRIIKAAGDYKDEKLSKTGNQMTEAINHINKLLTRLQKIKNLKIIQEERDKEKI